MQYYCTTNNIENWCGTSVETKPVLNIRVGSKFTETDTGKKFIFNGTNWVIKTQIDETTGQIITISPEHYQLHKGNAYSVTSILGNLATTASMYLEFITPIGKKVSLQAYNVICDQLVKSEFYEAPTITTEGTTSVPLIQRIRESSNSALTKIYNNPSGVSGGTLLRTLVFGNISGQANSIRPLTPTVADSLGFNLKPNTKYIAKITNLSASTTTILFLNLDIYEY